MSTRAALLTVAEYERIPDPLGGKYELRHGELVLVPPPVFQHGHIGGEIVVLLRHSCGRSYYVASEMACRPLPEYEVWSVDVGMTTRERVRAIREGWLMGAPELVVEVLSPSNTKTEMDDRQRTMFNGGCRQFWIVDPKQKTVRVSTPDGHSQIHASGDHISLAMFGGSPIAVDDIFAEP